MTFVKIAEEIAGFRQIGKVIPLLREFRVAQEALKVAQGGVNSLTDDAAKAQAALAVRINKVKEEFLALVRSITETTTFQVLAATVLTLAENLIRLGEAIKPYFLFGCASCCESYEELETLLEVLVKVCKQRFCKRWYGSHRIETLFQLCLHRESLHQKSMLQKCAGNLAAMNTIAMLQVVLS